MGTTAADVSLVANTESRLTGIDTIRQKAETTVNGTVIGKNAAIGASHKHEVTLESGKKINISFDYDNSGNLIAIRPQGSLDFPELYNAAIGQGQSFDAKAKVQVFEKTLDDGSKIRGYATAQGMQFNQFGPNGNDSTLLGTAGYTREYTSADGNTRKAVGVAASNAVGLAGFLAIDHTLNIGAKTKANVGASALVGTGGYNAAVNGKIASILYTNDNGGKLVGALAAGATIQSIKAGGQEFSGRTEGVKATLTGIRPDGSQGTEGTLSFNNSNVDNQGLGPQDARIVGLSVTTPLNQKGNIRGGITGQHIELGKRDGVQTTTDRLFGTYDHKIGKEWSLHAGLGADALNTKPTLYGELMATRNWGAGELSASEIALKKVAEYTTYNDRNAIANMFGAKDGVPALNANEVINALRESRERFNGNAQHSGEFASFAGDQRSGKTNSDRFGDPRATNELISRLDLLKSGAAQGNGALIAEIDATRALAVQALQLQGITPQAIDTNTLIYGAAGAPAVASGQGQGAALAGRGNGNGAADQLLNQLSGLQVNGGTISRGGQRISGNELHSILDGAEAAMRAELKNNSVGTSTGTLSALQGTLSSINAAVVEARKTDNGAYRIPGKDSVLADLSALQSLASQQSKVATAGGPSVGAPAANVAGDARAQLAAAGVDAASLKAAEKATGGPGFFSRLFGGGDKDPAAEAAKVAAKQADALATSVNKDLAALGVTAAGVAVQAGTSKTGATGTGRDAKTLESVVEGLLDTLSSKGIEPGAVNAKKAAKIDPVALANQLSTNVTALSALQVDAAGLGGKSGIFDRTTNAQDLANLQSTLTTLKNAVSGGLVPAKGGQKDAIISQIDALNTQVNATLNPTADKTRGGVGSSTLDGAALGGVLDKAITGLNPVNLVTDRASLTSTKSGTFDRTTAAQDLTNLQNTVNALDNAVNNGTVKVDKGTQQKIDTLQDILSKQNDPNLTVPVTGTGTGTGTTKVVDPNTPTFLNNPTQLLGTLQNIQRDLGTAVNHGRRDNPTQLKELDKDLEKLKELVTKHPELIPPVVVTPPTIVGDTPTRTNIVTPPDTPTKIVDVIDKIKDLIDREKDIISVTPPTRTNDGGDDDKLLKDTVKDNDKGTTIHVGTPDTPTKTPTTGEPEPGEPEPPAPGEPEPVVYNAAAEHDMYAAAPATPKGNTSLGRKGGKATGVA
jgi:hypothetical protein